MVLVLKTLYLRVNCTVSQHTLISYQVSPNSIPDRTRLIDEYGELDRQVQQFAPILARHELLKSIIKSWYVDQGPEAVGVIEGEQYEIQIGAKGTVRSWISLAKVAKEVGGMKELIALCPPDIGAVENVIGKARTSALLAEAQTGTRRIKAVAKAATVRTHDAA